MTVSIRPVAAPQTYPLRAAVLRPGMPLQSAIYPGDESAFHFGAFSGENVVGVASLYEENEPGTKILALRLRGMAVAPGFQGAGIGRELIAACLESARERKIDVVWCNARTSAVGFYPKLGFEIVGEEFELEGVGPHFVMRREI